MPVNPARYGLTFACRLNTLCAIRAARNRRAQGRTAISNPYDTDLGRNAANFTPLSPISHLMRSAAVYPDKPAVIHDRVYSYRELGERCRRLASALEARGLGWGDTISVMAPNIPAMLEAHYGIPMMGGVLNALNIRLDAATIAFILEHGESKAILTDREFAPVIEAEPSEGWPRIA